MGTSFATDWNYKDNGPDSWPIAFSQCDGTKQSPIDIKPSIAVYNNNLKPIIFKNYNQNIKWNISNTGTSGIIFESKYFF